MAFIRTLVGLISLGYVSAQVLRYHPVEQYVGPDFFKYWNFYTGADPTHGTVEFVSEWDGRQNKLLSASESGVVMRVDNTSVVAGEGGRKAVRIESKNSYNGGLFVLTLDNVPTACGAWPAFWMFGDDAQHAWPRWGEYDILESIHMLNYATTTLHTRESCDQREVNNNIDFVGQGWATGSLGTNKAKNCWVKAPQEFSNQGCGQKLPEASFGPAFNKNGGGTFVAEWENHELAETKQPKMMRTWFFPKGQEPIDLVAKAPQPDLWGTPNSYFTLEKRWCTADHFKNMKMVFDTTFCGDYAGSTFQANCPWIKQSCEDYVRNNPQAFSDAFWHITELDVYQKMSMAQLAAQAPHGPDVPVFVLHDGETTQGNDGNGASAAVSCMFLLLMGGAAGSLYYFYNRNEKVKGKVDEFATAARLPEAYRFVVDGLGRAKMALTQSLRQRGCIGSGDEAESPGNSPRLPIRKASSREFRGPPSPQGAAPPQMMSPTLSMGHRPSLAGQYGQSPGATRVHSGSLPFGPTGSSNNSTMPSVARAAQPEAHHVPQPGIYSPGMIAMAQSRELSGPLPAPQPDGSRQNSASLGHQVSSGSGRAQAFTGSGRMVTHAASNSSQRVVTTQQLPPVTYVYRP
ncbi:Probable glycosidase C21B10.07 [Durusdinium trenchii]|uniref:Probable glycosidase C21B10.07 n=1 Tax=Durusdinium trenchii TaxID=1381693 RepID=A0ABP0LIZ3_9DINO